MGPAVHYWLTVIGLRGLVGSQQVGLLTGAALGPAPGVEIAHQLPHMGEVCLPGVSGDLGPGPCIHCRGAPY